MTSIKIELVEDGQLPVKAHATDAAYDCFAREVSLINKCLVCKLGFRIELPVGWVAELRPRSSIYKTGLILSNSPGTIDSGYRGEVIAVFYVQDLAKYGIGDRVCQMIIKKLDDVELYVGKVNMETDRGEGGYGSTGR